MEAPSLRGLHSTIEASIPPRHKEGWCAHGGGGRRGGEAVGRACRGAGPEPWLLSGEVLPADRQPDILLPPFTSDPLSAQRQRQLALDDAVK